MLSIYAFLLVSGKNIILYVRFVLKLKIRGCSLVFLIHLVSFVYASIDNHLHLLVIAAVVKGKITILPSCVYDSLTGL